MKYSLSIVLSLFSMLGFAQQFVGVNTNDPTETMDVDGTVRIRILPEHKQVNAVRVNGTEVNPTGTFNAKYLVVSNENGVLGRSSSLGIFPFYMPPTLLPLNSKVASPGEYDGGTQTYSIDLYERFRQQFSQNGTIWGSTSIPLSTVKYNNGAAALPLPEKRDLYYYITYYDKEVFSNITLNEDGILTYKLTGQDPTEHTFMNIIFAPKTN